MNRTATSLSYKCTHTACKNKRRGLQVARRGQTFRSGRKLCTSFPTFAAVRRKFFFFATVECLNSAGLLPCLGRDFDNLTPPSSPAQICTDFSFARPGTHKLKN